MRWTGNQMFQHQRPISWQALICRVRSNFSRQPKPTSSPFGLPVFLHPSKEVARAPSAAGAKHLSCSPRFDEHTSQENQSRFPGYFYDSGVIKADAPLDPGVVPAREQAVFDGLSSG